MSSQPSDVLLEFILGFLTPLLMAGCTSDLGLARLAAIETLTAYHPRTPAELVNIAQIVAYGLTAMDNLRLSMAPDLPLSMKIRLRMGANALNRSAQQNTKGLAQGRRGHPPPAHQAAAPGAMQGQSAVPDPAAIGPGVINLGAIDPGTRVRGAGDARVAPPAGPQPQIGTDLDDGDHATPQTAPGPAPVVVETARPGAPVRRDTVRQGAQPVARPADPARPDLARPDPARPTSNRRAHTIDLMWANAMTEVAYELRHGRAHHPTP